MARIGGTKCQVCGQQDATVSKTATGTLSISCHRCEATAFAKVGTKAHRLVSAAMTPDDEAPFDFVRQAPAAAPVVAAIKTKPTPQARENPPPVAPPAPAPRRVASVFALSDL